MLFKWENGDAEVVELWKTMNGWVYEGFDKTYADLGISFNRTYYESQTYLFGKALVQKGLADGTLGVYETDRFVAPPGISLNLDCDGSDADAEMKAEDDDAFFFE